MVFDVDESIRVADVHPVQVMHIQGAIDPIIVIPRPPQLRHMLRVTITEQQPDPHDKIAKDVER
jgi:hypothetical protein